MLKEPLSYKEAKKQSNWYFNEYLQDNWNAVPFIPDLDKQIFEKITACPESFDMGIWHGRKTDNGNTFNIYVSDVHEEAYKCGTTHCLAGWACVLGGVAALALEHHCDTEDVAAAIFAKSTGSVPNFYGEDEEGLAEMRKRIGEQGDDNA